MKKIALFILFTFILSFSAKAQWMQLPQDTDLQNCSVFFINPDTGFVCGDWHYQHTYIQRTLDGGLTWDSTLMFNGLMPMSIFFVDDTTGYCGGQDGDVFKTINMGQTWFYISHIANLDDYGALYFTSKDTGFAADFNGRILKTTNGAQTWTLVSPLQQSFENYFPGTGKFHFLTDSIGFLANGNYGLVMKTIDAGNNWTSINLPTTNTWALSLYMFNKDSGMVTAENGKIWHTVNGGSSWTLSTIPGGYDLLDVTFFNDSVGYIVGGENNNYVFHSPPYPSVGGIIYVTYDAGATWHVDAMMCCDWLTSICNAGNNVAYAVGWNSWAYKLDNATVNVSVHEIANKNQLEIYPNPVSDVLHISNSHANSEMEITDITGRIILSGKNKNEIDLSGFSDGIYFLTLRTKEENISEKIIVRH